MAKSIETTQAPEPEFTSGERAAVKQIARGLTRRTRAPDLKLDFDEEQRSLKMRFDHNNQVAAQSLAMVQMGTCDFSFYQGLLSQLASLGEHGQAVSEKATNFALGVIAGIEPRDEVEAMLAAQMAATHQATMMMARRLNHVETIPQQDAAERAFNKLARTYATQMDALKRYRAKAQQTVRVERVTVNEGGQAIVGNVSHAGGGNDKTGR